MITNIEMWNLRGVRHGKLDGLSRVTVFVGGNGSGKTTTLEAIGLSQAPDGGNAFAVLGDREWLGTGGMASWFSNKDQPLIVEASGIIGGEVVFRHCEAKLGGLSRQDVDLLGSRILPSHVVFEVRIRNAAVLPQDYWRVVVDDDGWPSISYSASASAIRSTGPFSYSPTRAERPAGARHKAEDSVFVSADRTSLDAAKRNGTYDALEDYLRVLKPRLKNIESLGIGSRSEPHVIERDPHAVYPLAYAGEGFREALALAGTLGSAKGGVCTVDEPESHGHPTIFRGMAAMTRAAAMDGTQVFFATHSLDFIKALGAEFENTPDVWSIVGLRMEKGELTGQRIDGARAIERLFDLGDDVRL